MTYHAADRWTLLGGAFAGLALLGASCQFVRPLAAPPAATSNLTLSAPGPLRATAVPLGGRALAADARADGSRLVLSLRLAGPASAPCELALDFGEGQSIEGLDLDLASASATLTTAGGRTRLFVDASEPLLMLRCNGPALRLGEPGPELAVASRSRRQDGTEIAIAVGPSGEAEPAARLAEAALASGFDHRRLQHRAHWSQFWSASRVLVPVPELQAHYDLAKYLLGAGRAAGLAPDGDEAPLVALAAALNGPLAAAIAGCPPELATPAAPAGPPALAAALTAHTAFVAWRHHPGNDRRQRAEAALDRLLASWNAAPPFEGALALHWWSRWAAAELARARGEQPAAVAPPPLDRLDDASVLLAAHPLGVLDLADPPARQRVEAALGGILARDPGGRDPALQAWAACLLSRLDDPARAWPHLERWLADAPEVPRAPLLGMQAVHELLVRGSEPAMEVFPAVPDDWAEAEFQHLRLPGGHWTTAVWRESHCQSVVLFTGSAGTLRLRSPFPHGVVLWNAEVVHDDGEIEALVEANQKLSGTFLIPLARAQGDGG